MKIEGSATKSGEEVQRMTFTHDEWKSFYMSMRSYVAKVKNRLSDKDAFERELVKDMSDRIALRVRKSLQPTDKAKKKTSKKSKGIAKAKPFPSVKPPQPSVSNATQQATPPNSAVGSQSFTSKDISDIRNNYLQKQSEL